MKKAVAWGLAVILCLLVLCGCSSEKGIEDPVELAMEQLGRPTAEAYRNMGLLGDPEKASELFYLFALNGAEVLGKRLNVAIVHAGGMKKSDKLTEMRTECVSYSNLLDGDYDYPFKLYHALREAYGEPEPLSGGAPFLKVPFSEATPDSLKGMSGDDLCVAFWKEDDYEMELHAEGKDGGYVVLEIKVPIESLDLPPLYADDGTRIR